MSKKTYFQYYKEKEMALPIYIAIDINSFEKHTLDFLQKMKFVKLSEVEEVAALKIIKESKLARILTISEVSPIVAKQLHSVSESDRYGAESITPKEGYRVYRYKSTAMIVYSFSAKEWQLGCFKEFGARETMEASMMVMNRYLSLALSSFGILGLWGVSVQGGMVCQKPHESKGEVVFFDLQNAQLLTMDGIVKMNPNFKVLRLDPMLKGKNVKMSNEEYLSFISAYCSFFEFNGPSVPVRQMIHTLVKMTEGLYHPEESFRPRTDLSL